MNLRDPKIQKIMVVVLALIAMSYVYFGTSVLPFCYGVRKARITELQNEHTRLSAELEKARQMVGSLAKLEAEYERLHLQWESAQELLPLEEEMPDLLRKVTTAGNKAGVEFMLFQPKPPVVKELFKEHPVSVRVRGGYHELGTFLSGLANMSRIVNVTDIKVNQAATNRNAKNAKKSKSNGLSETVIADFTLSAFTLIEGAGNETARQDG
jgi:type IV pilus assembly protein PilO